MKENWPIFELFIAVLGIGIVWLLIILVVFWVA